MLAQMASKPWCKSNSINNSDHLHYLQFLIKNTELLKHGLVFVIMYGKLFQCHSKHLPQLFDTLKKQTFLRNCHTVKSITLNNKIC